MNYYNILLSFIIVLSGIQQKQFVNFDKDEVRQTKQKELIIVVIPFNIDEGYHIQAESETKDNLIATEITFEKNKDFNIIDQEFSLTHYETVVLNQFTHKVLSNKLEVTVTLKPKRKISSLNNKLKGKLYYQACDDRQCFFPRTLNFVATIK